jgi:hypothetical protein
MASTRSLGSLHSLPGAGGAGSSSEPKRRRARSAGRALAPWLLAATLVWAAPAHSQEPPVEPLPPAQTEEEQEPVEERARRLSPAEPEWNLGLRAGAFQMTNSSRSYDAVYGDPLFQAGGQVEVRLWHRFVVIAGADWGEVSGRRVLLTPRPTPTEAGVTLTYVPAHLTLGWYVLADRAWEVYLGGGPSYLTWSQSGVVRGDSGTSTGAHAALGVRRPTGERLVLGGDLRWAAFPNAMGDHGVSAYFGDDDMGGVTFQLLAQWRLRQRGPAPD